MRVIPNKKKVWPGFIYAFLASPYGQLQIQQRAYGSVIPELRDFQFNSIALRLPQDKGEAIHHKVVQAFDDRADAKAKEDAALSLFMSALANGRAYVESEWGKEY
jgi:restriction endonuclease S subunit